MQSTLSLRLTIAFLLTSPLLAGVFSELDCGKGYDSYSGETKERVVPKSQCKIVTQNAMYRKIAVIEDYETLLGIAEVPQNEKFFQNHLVQKLVENRHINHFTVTIAFYERVDLFANRTTAFPLLHESNSTKIYQKYGDCYIAGVVTGAKHLMLFHIPTCSAKEYRQLKKRAGKIETLPELQKFLSALKKQKREIIVKTFVSPRSDFTGTEEWEKRLTQPDQLKQALHDIAQPYRYILKSLPCDKDQQREEKLHTDIQTVLGTLLQSNDYHYYRRHIESFLPADKQKRHRMYQKSKQSEHLRAIISQKKVSDLNLTEYRTMDIAIPQRYLAPLPVKPLSIPPRSVAFTIENFADRISPDANISIRLTSNIDLLQKGKLLRITDTLTVIYKGKRYRKKEKHILIDTYVDYPDLYISELASTYGSLNLYLPFNRYEKHVYEKGEGIIDQVACSYELDNDATLHILCNRIRYRPLQIAFRHIEDRKQERSNKE